jgi:hypothetical protein
MMPALSILRRLKGQGWDLSSRQQRKISRFFTRCPPKKCRTSSNILVLDQRFLWLKVGDSSRRQQRRTRGNVEIRRFFTKCFTPNVCRTSSNILILVLGFLFFCRQAFPKSAVPQKEQRLGQTWHFISCQERNSSRYTKVGCSGTP